MSRSTAHRPIAVLAALVFLFAWTGDALGLHPCPHHSAVPGAEAHASAVDDVRPDAHAGHGGEAESAAPDRDVPDHGGEHAVCTCLGSCPSAHAGALPEDAGAGLRVAPSWVRESPSAAAAAVRPLLLPYVLPYGQAPPALG